ncbi:MAG: DUF5103 domain-containing protein [Saprospiraceae bacterium]
MKQLLSLLFGSFAFFTCSLSAQTDFAYIDQTMSSSIRSVAFMLNGEPQLFPALQLNSDDVLLLSFDDVDAEVKNYVYSVYHCNQDWTPSDLSPLEYLDGFDEENISDVRFSSRTLMPYTHYEAVFPNYNMNVTKSGNYLLVVYENEYDKIPVLTRRFVVVETMTGILPKNVRPVDVSQLHTHQEIDFTVQLLNVNVRNPLAEIKTTIIQNQRWDNAISGITPKFVRGNDIVFDYQGQVVFPGGNEFRFIDLRGLRTPQRDIEALFQGSEGFWEAQLAPIYGRGKGVYLSFADFNGKFVLDNFDQPAATINSEYIYTWITYEVEEPYYDSHLYLFGGLTEWLIKPEFKLVYNPAIHAYSGRFLLKQGYYNYHIVTVPSDTPKGAKKVPDISRTEGNHSDTENDYTILVYYRPFGGRYDQIIGYRIFDTWGNPLQLLKR